jgi:hypothetical protein
MLTSPRSRTALTILSAAEWPGLGGGDTTTMKSEGSGNSTDKKPNEAGKKNGGRGGGGGGGRGGGRGIGGANKTARAAKGGKSAGGRGRGRGNTKADSNSSRFTEVDITADGSTAWWGYTS